MSVKEKLEKLKKKAAAGSVFYDVEDVPYWISTGVFGLDTIMGGGIPGRNLVVVAGVKSIGKSELVYSVIKEVVQIDGLVLLIDSERSFTRRRAKRTGFDPEQILYARPKAVETMEVKLLGDKTTSKEVGVVDLMDTTIKLARQDFEGKKLLICWDSVAATAVAQEMEQDSGSHLMGKHARLVSQGLRKLMTHTDDLDVSFLFINQLKEKIGTAWGKNTTYIAEKPLDFHAAITIEMTSAGLVKEGKSPVGIRTKATITKNRVEEMSADPKAFFNIYYKTGISWWETVIDFLEQNERFGSTKGWLVLPSGEKFRRAQLVKVAEKETSIQNALEDMMSFVEVTPRTIIKDGHIFEPAKKKKRTPVI
jgi:recombination protein RecA